MFLMKFLLQRNEMVVKHEKKMDGKVLHFVNVIVEFHKK